jgi:adenylate kinase family enzyme
VGSGKTWLAERIAERLSLPLYQTEKMAGMHTASAGRRHSEEIRRAILQSVMAQEKWIIEGVHHRWLNESFRQADVIVYLDTPIGLRRRRIVSRFVKQCLGLEQAPVRPTPASLLRQLRRNREFDMQSRPDLLSQLEPYRHKLIILDDSSRLEPYLAEWAARSEVLPEAAGD